MTHGYGPYRHMPADVAVQGLAQDLVTLGIAVPALILTLVWARRGSRRGHLALAGVTGYSLAPVYAVFVSVQMLALLAKIVWMTAIGASAGPALILIPLLLCGAVGAAVIALDGEVRRPRRTETPNTSRRHVPARAST